MLEEFSVFKDVEERTALKGRRRGEAASRDANSRKIHSGLRFPFFFFLSSPFFICVHVLFVWGNHGSMSARPRKEE